MGDATSCCDAKTQIHDLGQRINYSEPKKTIQLTFQPPQFSKQINEIIYKAKNSQYFKKKEQQQYLKSAKLTNAPSQHQNYKKLHDRQQCLSQRSNYSTKARVIKIDASNQTIFYEGVINSKKQPHGYGCLYFVGSKNYFQGSFLNGMPQNGVMIFSQKMYYVGDISPETLEAKGAGMFINISTGYEYQGEWTKSLPHGKGIEKFPNGDYFQGGFMFGSKFGEGTYKFNNGNVYVGNFYNGLSDGFGKLTIGHNNDYYQGDWKLGMMDGKGYYKWVSKHQSYLGQYKQGKRNGFGKYQFSNNSFYEGMWKEGVQDGQGSIKQGYDEVRGVWQNGVRVQ